MLYETRITYSYRAHQENLKKSFELKENMREYSLVASHTYPFSWLLQTCKRRFFHVTPNMVIIIFTRRKTEIGKDFIGQFAVRLVPSHTTPDSADIEG